MTDWLVHNAVGVFEVVVGIYCLIGLAWVLGRRMAVKKQYKVEGR